MDDGGCTIGIWPNLQPSILSSLVDEERKAYAGGYISLYGQDFVKIALKTPLSTELVLQKIEVSPAPGICYVDSKGTILLSLSEKAPPTGFHLIGQGATKSNAVEAWKSDGKPRTIISSGDRRI